jgi:hypothetical protein
MVGQAKVWIACAGVLVVWAVPQTLGDLRTVTFSNPPGVPSGHLPDTGGILTPTSQNFVESGVHVEAFWAPNELTGFRSDAHFHHLEDGYETSHGFRDDRQGLYIRMVDGSSFDLVSLDFRLLSLPAGTDILISSTFDPLQPADPQFTAFHVSQSSSFSTLQIDGFENLTQVFISSVLSANQLERVRWDNVVVDPHISTAAVPVPAPLLMGALGLGMVAWGRRKWAARIAAPRP